ncbi:N-acetylgalactosamine 6-sulfate sulfatase (GALNS) [Catenovulum agarivorans DS-2]|uniref:N-acetylgalactosamine 6-sulfate sulfatase (GALNS) n=1 Tax=Catenovulum agarivorans DS-2 TaxID=1328313 RepID=W7QX07_9ALTE|nr:arylsulfatase [Catenovulum agarivorans]EWH09810.1 N-acetylgalactosamine 6-sulfate sulfatase (GALNS) [Catenovulum agarivorans DS-2]
MSNFVKSFVLTSALCAGLTACSGQQASQVVSDETTNVKPVSKQLDKPNIVLILADDIGFSDIGINGQKNFTTPNLDKMAEQGINFSQFYAGSAVCAPSRSVLLTGQHSGRTPIKANYMAIPQQDGSMLYQGGTFTPEQKIVSEVLKDAGYTTGIVGKWGLGEAEDTGHPNRKGFDYFFGYLNHVHAHNHFTDFLWRNYQQVPLKNKVEKVDCSYCDKFAFDGFVTPLEARYEYVDSLLRDEAVAFIDRNANQDKPFFLYYSLISPHANNEADQVDYAHGLEIPSYGEFADKNWPESAKGYAAMMRHIDHAVGQVMAKLKEQGIADNTIVIFTGDNGPHQEAGNNPDFHDSNGELRGIKRDLYEGGIRMPTIAWGPGLVPQGKVSDHIGYGGDFMATFAELAQTSIPNNTRLDSLSFANELTGKTQTAEHEHIYWEFHLHGSSQAVRKGKWKAIRLPLMTGPIELYDLENDPSESINLAAKHPELVAEFAKIMAENHLPHPHWPISKSDQSPDRQRNPIFK